MKVLFACSNSRDYTAGTLWDGLRAALGQENVVDATDSAYLRGLHEDRSNPDPNAELLVNPNRTREHRLIYYGEEFLNFQEDGFGLLVAVTSFLRENTWDDLRDLKNQHAPHGKLVWVETLDSPAEIFCPPFEVDAVFRREIDPAVQYPYGRKPLPLLGAIPRRWFDWPKPPKKLDVFGISSAVTPLPGFPERWNSLQEVFRTQTRHSSIIGSGAIELDTYLDLLRRSKLCIVANGGGASSDGPRQWEAIAAGAIPVFVGQPCRVRWPWFTDDEVFWCETVAALPNFLDRALGTDLPGRLAQLQKHALREHTTEARARQFLDLIERDAWCRQDVKPWCW